MTDEGVNDDDDERLLRDYFVKWCKVVPFKRANSKKGQIAEFLKRLIEEKEKLSERQKSGNDSARNTTVAKFESNPKSQDIDVKDSTFGGKYLYRYQALKQINALQKAKLDEQRRYIEELKLNRIVKEVVPVSETVNDVMNTLSQCSRKVRPKMKWLLGGETTASSSESNSNQSLSISCLKVPKMYQKMEQRAREREEKRAIVMERKRQLDLERDRIKEQMILEKQMLQQEEIEKRMNEFKENRRKEQLLAIRRKEEREKMRALQVMADLHYEKSIKIKYGPSTWKQFVVKVREDNVKAEKFNVDRIKTGHFRSLLELTRQIQCEKITQADNMYNNKLKTLVFIALKKLVRNTINKMQTAEDWHDMSITYRIFNEWKVCVDKIKKIRQQQWKLAEYHYNCQLKWKVIGCWQNLPMINECERRQEARKERWRSRVKQVLPDFIPKYID